MNELTRISLLKSELLTVRGAAERIEIKSLIADIIMMTDLDNFEKKGTSDQITPKVVKKQPVEPTAKHPTQPKEINVAADDPVDSLDEPADDDDFDNERDPIEQYEAMDVSSRFTEAERGWLRGGVFCRSADVRDMLSEEGNDRLSHQAISSLKNRGVLNYELGEGAGNCDYYRWSVLLRKYRIKDPQAKRKHEGTT